MRYINKNRVFILIVTLILLFSILITYAGYVGRDISGSVVRLHIIANSDSETDQQLKLKVRDRLIRDAAHIFKSSSSPADALETARKNTDLLNVIARDEIERQGFDYPVNVKVGKYPFPTKAYGEIMLPAGSYNAVRVEIGNASGENWWCVMFPPLCFTDSVVSVPEKSQKLLKDNLTESEYNLITGKDSGAIPVEVRFKIVEIFQRLF